MAPLLVLSSADIDWLVSRLSVHDILENQARTFDSFSSSRAHAEGAAPASVQNPPRISVLTDKHTVLFQPARVRESGGTAIKVVSVPQPGAPAGLPAATLVLDEATGRTKAIINAGALTGLRTAGGSVLATYLLVPAASKPQNLVVFGRGTQGQYHASLLAQLYPSLSNITFVSSSASPSAEIDDLGRKLPGRAVTVSADTEAAVRGADIICCCTPSTQPLFKSAWVRTGTHINLIGSYKPHMQEVEPALIHRATGRIIVDSTEHCAHEAGDLIQADVSAASCTELGRLVKVDGSSWSPDEGGLATLSSGTGDVTLFKSVGVAVQDVSIAHLMMEKAVDAGVGTTLDF